MKVTGMARRIDPQGRVVIPKEVRRILNLPEGTPMEIFTDGTRVILKKYIPEENLLNTVKAMEKQLELEESDMQFHKAKEIRKHLENIQALLSDQEGTCER